MQFFGGDLEGDGIYGTMNYSGFSWPVWSWLRSPDTIARAFGRPVQVARRSGPAVVDTFRAWQGALDWQATTSSWNILGSHDFARIRTVVGGDAALHRVAAGLQFTMPWDSADLWDTATLDTYAELARVRRSRAALRRGGQRWAYVDDAAPTFRPRNRPDPGVWGKYFEKFSGGPLATNRPRIDIWAIE